MSWRAELSEGLPRPVSSSLAELAADLGAPPPAVAAAVFSHWEELVGTEVAAHTTPLSLREGVLVVAVDDPAWAVQLRFLGGELKERIGRATGREDVCEVRLCVRAGPHPSRRRA